MGLRLHQGMPVVTAEAMRDLDRLAVEKYKIPVLDLMENAGRAVALETRKAVESFGRPIAGARLVVCCGRGANGGDGLVAARHLAEFGAEVTVFLCPPKKDASGAPGAYPAPVLKNLERARAAGIEVMPAGPESGLRAKLEQAVAALDALLGTGSSGAPAGAIHHMITELNLSKKPLFAVDIPSGLQPDTGAHSGAVVRATATFTLGLAKKGLLMPQAKPIVGIVKVLDIGYPKELVAGITG